MLEELASDCWSHELCQGIHEGDAACYSWAAYICGGTGDDTKGGVNGGPSMVESGAMTGYILLVPV
jgi:hypothetical protein